MPQQYGRGAGLAYKRDSSLYKATIKAPLPARFQGMLGPDADVGNVANIMDLTYFLVRYLSGKDNIMVTPNHSGGYAVGKEDWNGKEIFNVTVPEYKTYRLPVDGIDKFRIYRNGTWHETCHIKHTPEQIFAKLAKYTPVEKHIVNIVEDRRIEELGIVDWQGYVPERLYSQAYAYVLRPEVTGMFNTNEPADSYANQNARLEAFLQRMLIGEVKGVMPPADEKLVEDTAAAMEKRIEELNKDVADKKVTSWETAVHLEDMKEDAMRMLKIARYMPQANPNNPSQQQPQQGQAGDPSQPEYDQTFTPQYAKQREEEEEKKKQENAAAGKPEKDEDKKSQKEKTQDGIKEFLNKKKGASEKSRKDGEKAKPNQPTQEEVDQAESGTDTVQNEFKSMQKKQTLDPSLGTGVSPVITQMPSKDYRDSAFINTMNTELRAFKTGYKTINSQTGNRLDVQRYIQRPDEAFVRRLRQSVKGKKLLVLADFSGSMGPKQDEYKKALISSMEVLDGIGTKTAFFAFGRSPNQNGEFFYVKRFEEPKWTAVNARKLAALEASLGRTPTAEAYRRLEGYVRKMRPTSMVTVTDGSPDDHMGTREEVQKLRKFTKMVAFGLGDESMEKVLREFNYHKSFAVPSIHQIPKKLVKEIIE